MRVYINDAKEKESFIKRYKKTKKNFIVDYASGKRDIVPRNDYNERIILQKMHKQAEESVNKLKEARSTKIGYMRLFNISLMLLGIGTLGILGGASSILVYGLAIASFASGISFLSSYFKYRSIEKDIRKNRYFLKIEERLNKHIRDNRNMLAKVGSKTANLVKNAPKEEAVFNINNVSSVSLDNLKTMWSNIRRNEKFGFDYSEGNNHNDKVYDYCNKVYDYNSQARTNRASHKVRKRQLSMTR